MPLAYMEPAMSNLFQDAQRNYSRNLCVPYTRATVEKTTERLWKRLVQRIISGNKNNWIRAERKKEEKKTSELSTRASGSERERERENASIA